MRYRYCSHRGLCKPDQSSTINSDTASKLLCQVPVYDMVALKPTAAATSSQQRTSRKTLKAVYIQSKSTRHCCAARVILHLPRLGIRQKSTAAYLQHACVSSDEIPRGIASSLKAQEQSRNFHLHQANGLPQHRVTQCDQGR